MAAITERRLHGLGLVVLACLFLFIIICQTTNTGSIHHGQYPAPPTPPRENTNATPPQSSPQSSNNNDNNTLYLVSTLCVDKCRQSKPNDGDGGSDGVGDCRDYRTPFQNCFSGSKLFPNDPSWNSNEDILDTPINETHFRREFFTTSTTATAAAAAAAAVATTEFSCHQSDNDGYVELPYHECVGPFGLPRPWGSFQLLHDDDAAAVVEQRSTIRFS